MPTGDCVVCANSVLGGIIPSNSDPNIAFVQQNLNAFVQAITAAGLSNYRVLLITEATRSLLTRDFGEWVERPPAPLKGKREAVTLYARAKPSGAVAMIGSAWSEPFSPPRSAS